jgi:nucleoside-diphosphate-sugar epimerase
MTPARILLTGADGFVGRHLAAAVRAAFPGAELVGPRFDVIDAAAVSRVVSRVRPDACVHLAAVSAVADARENPDLAWQVNLHGTLHLARAILAHAPDACFLFASSADIYGGSFRSGGKLDESAAPAPLNTYGATKAAADLALGALAAEGLRAIRVRPFNHTGPGQPNRFVVPAFAEQIARIEAGQQPPVMQVGDLTSARDFLDVRDVCAAYVACLQSADSIPPGSIFNIASGVPRTIRVVLEELLAEAGVDVELETDPTRLRPSDIPTASGNAERAQQLLGWQPRISWQQTLRDVLADWRTRVR